MSAEESKLDLSGVEEDVLREVEAGNDAAAASATDNPTEVLVGVEGGEEPEGDADELLEEFAAASVGVMPSSEGLARKATDTLDQMNAAIAGLSDWQAERKAALAAEMAKNEARLAAEPVLPVGVDVVDNVEAEAKDAELDQLQQLRQELEQGLASGSVRPELKGFAAELAALRSTTEAGRSRLTSTQKDRLDALLAGESDPALPSSAELQDQVALLRAQHETDMLAAELLGSGSAPSTPQAESKEDLDADTAGLDRVGEELHTYQSELDDVLGRFNMLSAMEARLSSEPFDTPPRITRPPVAATGSVAHHGDDADPSTHK